MAERDKIEDFDENDVKPDSKRALDVSNSYSTRATKAPKRAATLKGSHWSELTHSQLVTPTFGGTSQPSRKHSEDDELVDDGYLKASISPTETLHYSGTASSRREI